MGCVRERRELVVVACLGKLHEALNGQQLGWRHEGDGRGSQGGQLGPQSRGEEAVELGQSSERSTFDARHRRARRDAKHDSDRHGLVVLEQQRRDVSPATEAITAPGTWCATDLITEDAELVHVASHGPGVHLETLGQIGPAPRSTPLEEP